MRLKMFRQNGKNVTARKDHHAAIYGHSMIVFGGLLENG